MKIKAACLLCQLEEASDWTATVELDKWPYIEMKCENGHRQRFMLSTELYELLFEQATRCLMDGYYREAIGTYNAALERFFEYAIEMMLTTKANIEFTDFWKNISNQSERQLGAYYALWPVTFNELPTKLDTKKVELRNAVVHKGKLASRKEAEEFGEYVYNYIMAHAAKINELAPGLPVTHIVRIVRQCKKDFENESKDPIYVEVQGEQSVLATGFVRASCLLSNPNVKSYADCLNQNFDNQYLELVYSY